MEGFAIGGILILFLLVVHFESLAGIAASLLPVFAGVVSMLGLMAATGMKINFMNAMVLVTILGMGSDYGLHVYHRLREGDGSEAGDRYVQAGRAVLLSALTTVAGFGSLAFTDYGAMSSIGWATNFGIGATAFFGLVALPAFLALRRNRKPARLPQKNRADVAAGPIPCFAQNVLFQDAVSSRVMIRTCVTPLPRNPSLLAASRERSMKWFTLFRQRSVMVTVTSRSLARFTTLTLVPRGRVGCAAVSFFGSYRFPDVVLLP